MRLVEKIIDIPDGMAWLACKEVDCGTIIKKARCPVCQAILGYVNEQKAVCIFCGVDWEANDFQVVCPRCNKGLYCSLLKFVKGGKVR